MDRAYRALGWHPGMGRRFLIFPLGEIKAGAHFLTWLSVVVECVGCHGNRKREIMFFFFPLLEFEGWGGQGSKTRSWWAAGHLCQCFPREVRVGFLS